MKKNNAARLLKVREMLGFSQREMAEELGVVHGAIGLWESNKRKIPGPVLKLLAFYEEELGINQNSSAEPMLNEITTDWLPRTLKLSKVGVEVVGKKIVSILKQLTNHEEKTSIRARTTGAIAKQLVKTFSQMKGLPQKFGQLLSYMDNEASDEVREIFSKLQYNAEPIRPLVVVDIFVMEFGKTPNQLFAKWCPEPFAAASIGQVHRAITKEGRHVAIKVQYPKIVDVIRADLKNATIIDRLGVLMLKNHKPGELLGEFSRRFIEECDYLQEADNQIELKKLHADNSDIIIPQVYKELSTKRVLTMEYIDGLQYAEFKQRATRAEKDHAAGIIWDHAFQSVFPHGVFNADPHPGNYLFVKDQVAFLDYGCVKRIPAALFEEWKIFLKAIVDDDQDGVSKSIVRMGIVTDYENFDYDRFYRLVRNRYFPCYSDKPFKFTREFVAKLWREMKAWYPQNKDMRFPKEMLFINQLQWGLYSVLADLEATAIWSKRFM